MWLKATSLLSAEDDEPRRSGRIARSLSTRARAKQGTL